MECWLVDSLKVGVDGVEEGGREEAEKRKEIDQSTFFF